MPFQSTSQQRWAFATGQPFAKRWAKQTNFKRLPYKKRQKALTLDQLESFVLSPHYDPATADAIAARIPALPSLKGEQIAPGITRIHGNLCNVHGKYGRCPGASIAPITPKKGRKPRQTPAQRAQARDAEHAKNRATVLAAQGYSPDDQASLEALRSGGQPSTVNPSLIDQGVVEQAQDGSYRLTSSGRALMNAAGQGDAGRARDTVSGARDRLSARRQRQEAARQRQQAAAGRHASAQIDRELRKREHAQAQAKRQAARAAKKPAKRPPIGRAPGARRSPPTPQPRKRGAFHFSGGPSSSGSAPKPKKPVAPKVEKPTKAQTTASNRQHVRDEMMNTDQGLAPAGFDNLIALGGGTEPDSAGADGLIGMGLAERGTDGVLRLTSAGRHAIAAANRGDAKAAIDVISRASEPPKAATEKAAPAPGDYLIVEDPQKSSTWHLQVKRNGKADHGLMGAAWAALHSGFRGNVYQGPQKGTALTKLRKLYASEGMDVPAEKAHAIARWDGRAWVKDGVIVAEPDQSQFAGYTMEDWDHDRPTTKPSPQAVAAARAQFAQALGLDTVAQPSTLKVFKDASGQMRWVAQSSTAYQDRDQEIVSTKALEDDCRFADRTHSYGPLRWWHCPGLDLGDCDFNAMHGRVLIESGTFRSPQIAQKVARAADALEISLGFLHLPTEPDASGVFHHIRRFERSLVPRGKASNRFTAFRVKERPMFDETKIAALKTLGFSDADITSLQTQAEATEKAAAEQHVAFKADEPAPPDEITIGGVVYTVKASAAPMASAAPIEGSPEEEAAETPEEEAAEPDAGMDDSGGLTLSQEDLDAIGQAVSQALTSALGPLVSTMDLTNKIGSHMDELKGMMGGYTAKKDATDAEHTEQIVQLQTALKETQDRLSELLGLQPAVTPRATEARATAINPFNPADNALLQAVKEQVPADQLPQYANGFEDLKQKLFGP